MGYKPVITDDDKQNVLYALRLYTNADRRIPVERLCEAMEITRRRLRFIVHEINADDSDHLVLTDTDEGGYWLAVKGADPEPAVKHYWEEDSRRANLDKKVKAMKRKIARIYGTEALDPASKLQAPLF
jgi:hypothetical protein